MAKIRINDASTLPLFPDFRNLGVMLRILLGVNLMLLLSTLTGSREADVWIRQLVDASLLVQPGLLLCLLLLWLINPWIGKQSAMGGYLAIAAVALASTAGLRWGLTVLLGPLDSFGWLRLVCLTLSMTIGGLAYFRGRIKALSPAITEARLQALQARIRPHFLFNSLNAVLSLIRTEPTKAERAIEDMADLFRVFMRENRELVTLKRELDISWQYLELERLRLGDRLVLEWNTDKMPEQALIPPLVLQPLLENAVYHGIEPSSKAGVVRIDIFRSDGEVHLVVRNPWHVDYEGRHAKGNRMAMANIRERLALHYDAEASIKASMGSDFYQVHIVLPYKEKR